MGKDKDALKKELEAKLISLREERDMAKLAYETVDEKVILLEAFMELEYGTDE